MLDSPQRPLDPRIASHQRRRTLFAESEAEALEQIRNHLRRNSHI